MTLLDLKLESGAEMSVRRFEAHEVAGAPFTLTVVARSPDPSVDLDAIVGRRASLHVEEPETAKRRAWSGIVARMEQIAVEPRGLSTYEVVIVPAIWLLGKRVNHRIFTRVSVQDIGATLLSEWGIEAEWWSIADPEVFAYRVQYGESDLAFLSRMLEASGVTMLFPEPEIESEGRAVGDVVRLHGDPSRATRREPRLTWIERPRQRADELRDSAHGVRVSREVRPGAHVLRDHDVMNPALPLMGGHDAAPKGVDREAQLERFHYEPGAFLVRSRGRPGVEATNDPFYGARNAARALLADRAGARAVAFEATTMDIGPGVVIAFEGHARSELSRDRDWLVTELHCSGGTDEVWRASVCAVPTDVPYHPPRKTPRPRVHGVQSALVVGEGEIHTDELGRVLVKFPWDRAPAANGETSCWIRPVHGWSGAGYGAFALPRVGQEVLVSFLDGNPDQPVIVGRLHNQQSPVNYPLPARKTESGHRSSTSPGGGGFNEIRLDDAAEGELFSLQAERDARKLVKNDESITIGNDRNLTIASNLVSEARGDRVQHTTGARRDDIALNHTEATTGSVTRHVTGKDIHRFEQSFVSVIDRDVDATTEKAKKERVKSHADTVVDGASSEGSDGATSISAASFQASSSGNAGIKAGGDLHIQAGNIVVDGANVTLKGQAGFMAVGSNVTIVGPIVKINEGGSPASLDDVVPAKADLPVDLLPADVLELDAEWVMISVESGANPPSDPKKSDKWTTIVGKRVKLKIQASSTVTEPVTWIISGNPVERYSWPASPPHTPAAVHSWGDDKYTIEDRHQAYVAPDEAVEFNWVSPGPQSVRVYATVGEHIRERLLEFDVRAPKVTQKRAEFGVTRIGKETDDQNQTDEWLRFGRMRCSDSAKGKLGPGIRFFYDIAADAGFDGELCGVQLVQPIIQYRKSGEESVHTQSIDGTAPSEMWSLDTQAPFHGIEVSVIAGTTATWCYTAGSLNKGDWMNVGDRVLDCPGVAPDSGWLYVAPNFAFTTYLMYKPDGAGSLWVTLASGKWSWKAAASRASTTDPWVMDPSLPTEPSPDLQFTDSHEQPVWSTYLEPI